MPRIEAPRLGVPRDILSNGPTPQAHTASKCAFPSVQEMALFASHDSFGVVDLGATKTVIGSDNLPSLIQGLSPEVRKKLERCKCQVTFRCANHGTLQSQHALIVPFQGVKLKIAVVPGSTPFLLSNPLLRAIEAVIDTKKQSLWSEKLKKTIPLHITNRGLFLLDLNDLMQPIDPNANRTSEPAETHLSIESSKSTLPCATQSKDVVDDSVNDDNDGKNLLEKEPHSSSPEAESKDGNNPEIIERSRTVTEPTCQVSESESLAGSKSLAVSFQVPSRVDHGKPGTSIEESSNGSRRTTTRLLSHVDPRTGGVQDRFRNEACWRQLPPRLDPRPSLGHVDGSALHRFQEGKPSSIPVLCRDED